VHFSNLTGNNKIHLEKAPICNNNTIEYTHTTTLEANKQNSIK